MKAAKSWLVRAVCVAGLVGLGAAGCGDDDGDGGEAGQGGQGGQGGEGGQGGSGAGAGGAGGEGGEGGSGQPDGGLSKAECLEMSVQEVPAECLECACEAAPDATAQCGADCWSLLVCVAVTCGGDLSDLDCITSECANWASGAATAMAMIASPVVAQCMQACTLEGDGGTDQDGGN
jgi:hypothetical protein